jgi:hypothetical protein
VGEFDTKMNTEHQLNSKNIIVDRELFGRLRSQVSVDLGKLHKYGLLATTVRDVFMNLVVMCDDGKIGVSIEKLYYYLNISAIKGTMINRFINSIIQSLNADAEFRTILNNVVRLGCSVMRACPNAQGGFISYIGKDSPSMLDDIVDATHTLLSYVETRMNKKGGATTLGITLRKLIPSVSGVSTESKLTYLKHPVVLSLVCKLMCFTTLNKFGCYFGFQLHKYEFDAEHLSSIQNALMKTERAFKQTSGPVRRCSIFFKALVKTEIKQGFDFVRLSESLRNRSSGKHASIQTLGIGIQTLIRGMCEKFENASKTHENARTTWCELRAAHLQASTHPIIADQAKYVSFWHGCVLHETMHQRLRAYCDQHVFLLQWCGNKLFAPDIINEDERLAALYGLLAYCKRVKEGPIYSSICMVNYYRLMKDIKQTKQSPFSAYHALQERQPSCQMEPNNVQPDWPSLPNIFECLKWDEIRTISKRVPSTGTAQHVFKQLCHSSIPGIVFDMRVMCVRSVGDVKSVMSKRLKHVIKEIDNTTDQLGKNSSDEDADAIRTKLARLGELCRSVMHGKELTLSGIVTKLVHVFCEPEEEALHTTYFGEKGTRRLGDVLMTHTRLSSNLNRRRQESARAASPLLGKKAVRAGLRAASSALNIASTLGGAAVLSAAAAKQYAYALLNGKSHNLTLEAKKDVLRVLFHDFNIIIKQCDPMQKQKCSKRYEAKDLLAKLCMYVSRVINDGHPEELDDEKDVSKICQTTLIKWFQSVYPYCEPNFGIKLLTKDVEGVAALPTFELFAKKRRRSSLVMMATYMSSRMQKKETAIVQKYYQAYDNASRDIHMLDSATASAGVLCFDFIEQMAAPARQKLRMRSLFASRKKSGKVRRMKHSSNNNKSVNGKQSKTRLLGKARKKGTKRKPLRMFGMKLRKQSEKTTTKASKKMQK